MSQGTLNSSHSPAVHPGGALPFCLRQPHSLPAAAVTRLLCEWLADHPGRRCHCRHSGRLRTEEDDAHPEFPERVTGAEAWGGGGAVCLRM